MSITHMNRAGKHTIFLDDVTPLKPKHPTSPVPFTFCPVDLVGAPHRLMRLMRKHHHDATGVYLPDSYFQALCLDGPEIRLAVEGRAKLTATAFHRQYESVLKSYAFDNNGRPVVALLCGDMLRADKSKFLVGMFSIFGVHGGTRYAFYDNLNDAQLALTKWANRIYRIGNGFVNYK